MALTVFAAIVVLLGGAIMLDPAAFADLPWKGLAPPDGGSALPGTPSATPSQPRASSAPPASRANRPAPSATPVLAQSGAFPASGPGTFTFDNTRGDVLGTAGTLRRFRVGIEQGVDQDMTAFAGKIDQVLGDSRSWIASGQLRLQRVPQGSSFDFTIFLATGDTARKLCAQGNVDIRINGEPYTSCRAPGKVIINLNRWRLSVPNYVDSKVPLEDYHSYVINHEVGHELGHGHELCPGAGRPAPVMQQQTLGLRGCTANAWPFLNGKRYAGQPGSYDSTAG